MKKSLLILTSLFFLTAIALIGQIGGGNVYQPRKVIPPLTLSQTVAPSTITKSAEYVQSYKIDAQVSNITPTTSNVIAEFVSDLVSTNTASIPLAPVKSPVNLQFDLNILGTQTVSADGITVTYQQLNDLIIASINQQRAAQLSGK